MAVPLFAEAALVIGAMLAYEFADIELSWLAIIAGILISVLTGRKSEGIKVDFPHLTERAMLYVVFTFGEMIIGLSGYFDGVSANGIYFSIMAFLIVVGLFVTYETLYDHIVDREQNNSGLAYMLIHVFLIFAMNNITSALEFMREDEIDIMPKMLFLVGSLLLFFVCIFLLGRYAKKRCRVNKKLIGVMAVSAVCFSVLMILLREHMKINILLTVAYVFGVFVTIHIFGRQQNELKNDKSEV